MTGTGQAGLRELHPQDWSAALERILLPRLAARLRSRADGHCMRVTDLDQDLMVRLCGRLRAEVPSAEVVILGAGQGSSTPSALTVSATKLVELRNPMPDGTQRPPLLVFLPPEVRAAAEDSYGVATFEELAVGDVYTALRGQLLDGLAPDLRGAVTEVLRRLLGPDDPWPFADPVAVVRFLLTAKINGNDAEALGAALYELGLVPDLELLARPEKAPARIARNRDCVGKLTWSAKSERGRVLDLALATRGLRAQLGDFVAGTGLEDPCSWTRRIVLDRGLWSLAFNRWEFEDGGEEPDSIFIGDIETNLPVVEDDEGDDRLMQLLGQRVLPLGKRGLGKFNVTFRVDPHPSKVQGLRKLTAQVISREHGPVGLARSKSTWRSGRTDVTVSFSRLSRIDWEEGWYFVRVLAQAEDGEMIPIVDAAGRPLPWAAVEDDPAPRANESDLFYVLPDGGVDVDPPQRAVQRAASLTHARTRQRFIALMDARDPQEVVATSVGWADRRSRGRAAGAGMLEVKLGREGTMSVPVSRPLKVLEQRVLAAADGPLRWRIPIAMGGAGQAAGEPGRWPEGEASDRFLAARARYFEAVRSGEEELITQGADLRALMPYISDYAGAYGELVQVLLSRAESHLKGGDQEALSDLRDVLSIDSVILAIRDHRGRRREAALVAPTHPLRALWLGAWAELCEHWLQASAAGPRELVVSTRDALLSLLRPVSFPPVLPTPSGRLMTAVDNLHPFWTLYAPPGEEDPRGLVGDVCAALGLPEPAVGGAAIDGTYLASRVRRYLVQHPYVRTLMINVFNPGRGGVLADMLLQLQKQPAFADIHYDLRLFVHDADTPGTGEALSDLLSPSAGVTAKEADAFSTPAESHLRPKLALAVRPIEEFRRAPQAHAAHLTLLFDAFPAEEIGAARASDTEWAAPVHGLVQDFKVEYREDEQTVAWTRQPRHGLASPLPGAEELTDLLTTLPAILSSAAAAVATGELGAGRRPVARLTLGAEERALLHQVHEVSDWVLTVDRNMGIEFFDHGGRAGRPEYLIDHSPDLSGGLGHRLVITSRSLAELQAILRPVLEQYGLTAGARHAVAILDQLRSLSGRLALKLISAPSQRAEALGLALCRMYLEHQGVFEDQVVVPLDAHLDLYHALRKSADELGDEVSFKRTDLALFDLDAKARTVTCRLVEVKCYNQVGDVGAFNQLKDAISAQIARSEEVLAHHFDPHRWPGDRPDRLIKVRELVTLLEFYLDRAVRYGVMSHGAEEEGRFLLRSLEAGYRLVFTRAAIIFDFEKPGTEPAELEGGIEYHRIGSDLIRQLLEAAARNQQRDGRESAPDADPGASSEPAPGDADSVVHRKQAPSVPSLEKAAFLAPPRDRTVSWDDLRARRAMGEEMEIASHPSSELDDTGSGGTDGSDGSGAPPPLPPASPSNPPPSSPLAAGPEGSKAGALNEDDNANEETSASAMITSQTKDKAPTAPPESLSYDLLLGATTPSPQYGILGEIPGRKVAIDLNQTHTISLFGVQGGGKSYTLGTIAEMASLPVPHINELPRPLATVIFHYSPTMDYEPEFLSMVAPNTDEAQVAALRDRYGAEPKALSDVVLLVPADKLEQRRGEHPELEVLPLKFAAAELQTSHWRFLMGAVGNRATYVRVLNRVMKALRNDLTLAGLRQGVEGSPLPDHLKEMARTRLDLAAEYIDDDVRLGEIIRPGRLIVVDLRDEFIEKEEALGLFVVLLQLFADARCDGESFNKLVVFDEAHKYIESPDLVAGLVEVVREMRHKGTSIMVASQDPPSVPVSLIELSSQIILHKFNSPAWLKHIQKANAALRGLTPDKMARLRPGEAFVWSSRATDEAFSKGAIKVKCRPRVTQHGGATKTAVDR